MEEELRKLVREYPNGGVVAYVGRIRADHQATFYEKREGGKAYGGCSCNDLGCNRPLWIEYAQLLLDSYEAKVADFAKETLRNSTLREQIAREIMENFDGGHTKGENDCSCQEDSDPCYFCGAKDYTGIAAAIARGEK